MDNYNYQSHNRQPRRRGVFSYLMVALIAGIIGGLISIYIAPTYLYGKIIPMPEIYSNSIIDDQGEVVIAPKEDITAVSAVAKKAMGTVVGITTVQIQRELLWERPVEGVGSGVVIHKDGFILTNSHVIGNGNAENISVLFENGDKMEGQVMWFDAALDLAIVKVNASNLQTADLGDSDSLEIGELAVAIGNPLGLDFQRTVTSGGISGLHRSIKVDERTIMEDLIQTDAAINPGNSGGPLLNNLGEVIGINTAKIKTGEGLGFAIPINIVKPIIEEVINKGTFNNVYIGFEGREVEIVERQLGIDLMVDNGVVVVAIVPNSAAAVSELKPLDIITMLDNQPVESMASLRKMLYKYKLGDTATLTVIREGTEIKVDITFKEF